MSHRIVQLLLIRRKYLLVGGLMLLVMCSELAVLISQPMFSDFKINLVKRVLNTEESIKLLKEVITQENPKPPNSSRVKMEHCNCSRYIKSTFLGKDIHYNETSCSRDAFARGPGQKVVAMAFFGVQTAKSNAEKGYFEGIKGNLDLLRPFTILAICCEFITIT